MTIVARAANGAINIIRLSGPKALEFAKILCKSDLKPRYAHLKKIYSSKDEILDEAIIIYFKSPKSFTGEDVVEFHTHGGDAVANLIISELLSLGARTANPGEFSKRAFLNGKMDLSKAETISAMISTRSANAAKILARSLCGELQIFCQNLKEELTIILAYSEVCIDYAEDDLPEDVLQNIHQKLNLAILRLENIVKISNERKGLIEGFKVAIIGRPNVGKSSILNSLLSYERAIVSEFAGTTRDTIEECVNIDGTIVRFVDTAGIRNAKDKIENIGISYSKKAANDADIVLCVFDFSSDLTKEDEEILNFANSLQKPVIFVLNKCDLEQKFPKNSLLLQEVVEISAKNDISALKSVIKSKVCTHNTSELLLSSNRQIHLCEQAANHLKESISKLNENELEIFAFLINQALKNIGAITSPVQNSEILDAMFSNFCLGK